MQYSRIGPALIPIVALLRNKSTEAQDTRQKQSVVSPSLTAFMPTWGGSDMHLECKTYLLMHLLALESVSWQLSNLGSLSARSPSTECTTYVQMALDASHPHSLTAIRAFCLSWGFDKTNWRKRHF